MKAEASMKQAREFPGRALFARAGWMTFYAGPQKGDERPRGGGEFTKKFVGHEVLNFARFDGTLYGWIQPAREAKSGIALERIDPAAAGANSLDSVLVVFIANDPDRGGQRVVGWYRQARVYRYRAKFPSSIQKRLTEALKRSGLPFDKFEDYSVETALSDAVLLPLRRRTDIVPHGKGGFGQSNVCYSLAADGKSKTAPWINLVLNFVESYAGENLLVEKDAEAQVDEAIATTLERAAGHQSDPAIRKAVEEWAMACAESYLRKKGCTEVQRTAATKCYDYTCRKNGELFYIEVKGTQTAGEEIALTRNEKAWAEGHQHNYILYVRHSVTVNSGKLPAASGGIERVLDPWDIACGSLKPAGWIYKLPP